MNRPFTQTKDQSNLGDNANQNGYSEIVNGNSAFLDYQVINGIRLTSRKEMMIRSLKNCNFAKRNDIELFLPVYRFQSQSFIEMLDFFNSNKSYDKKVKPFVSEDNYFLQNPEVLLNTLENNPMVAENRERIKNQIENIRYDVLKLSKTIKIKYNSDKIYVFIRPILKAKRIKYLYTCDNCNVKNSAAEGLLDHIKVLKSV